MKSAHAFTGLCANTRGASAVEFALVMPLFLMSLFGVIVYGGYFGVVHSVQQLTAEAARAAIGGLDDSERLTLARATIDSTVTAYPLLTSANIAVQSAATDPATSTFTVTLRYDASTLFIFSLPALIPAPDPVVIRSAAIQRGGY